MEREASAIARKVRNYIVLANEDADATHASDDSSAFKNIVLISLMGSALFFTQLTLFLVKMIKRLEA